MKRRPVSMLLFFIETIAIIIICSLFFVGVMVFLFISTIIDVIKKLAEVDK